MSEHLRLYEDLSTVNIWGEQNVVKLTEMPFSSFPHAHKNNSVLQIFKQIVQEQQLWTLQEKRKDWHKGTINAAHKQNWFTWKTKKKNQMPQERDATFFPCAPYL